MINLIPPTAKKGVRREYFLRVVVVYLWLMIIGGVIVGTLLMSPLIFIQYQTSVVSDEFAEAADQQAATTELVETIEADNDLLRELGFYTEVEPLMPLIDELQEIAGKAIEISEIRVSRDERGIVPEIVVSGTAATRQDLATFKQELEEKPNFDDIVLPLANLARDQDLPFQLTIPLFTTS